MAPPGVAEAGPPRMSTKGLADERLWGADEDLAKRAQRFVDVKAAADMTAPPA